MQYASLKVVVLPVPSLDIIYIINSAWVDSSTSGDASPHFVAPSLCLWVHFGKCFVDL